MFFDPDTKTKYFSTPTNKPSLFRPRRRNQVKFNPPHPNQVNIDQPGRMLVLLNLPHQNNVDFDPPLKLSQLDSHSNIRQFRSPHAKTKWISIPALKPSIYGPPPENQVNSVPHNEIRSSSIAHTEMKSISINTKAQVHINSPQKIKLNSTHHGNQAHLKPNSKFKLISMPPHKNQVYFYPDP